MKKIISLLLAFSMFLPTVSYAEGIVKIPTVQALPDESDVGDAVSPLKKGQKAPFTGVLFSPSAAATILTEITTFDERVKLEVENAKRICTAKCDFEKAEMSAHFDAERKVLIASSEEKSSRIQVLTSEITRLESEKTNPYLWTGVGVAGGTVVTLLTLFTINQVVK